MKAACEWIFDELDEDKSGFIEEKEGLLIAKYSGFHQAKINLFWDKMKSDMDTDGDGRISKEEYVTWMSQNRKEEEVLALKETLAAKLAQKKTIQALAEDFMAPDTAIVAAVTGAVEMVKMSALLPALEKAWAAGKTPLLIDDTDDPDPKKKQDFSPLETFWSYSGHAIFEAKKMVVEVNMKKEVPLEEAQEKVRLQLVKAMKHGQQFVITCSSANPPFADKFCSPAYLPVELFDHSKVNAVIGEDVKLEDTWAGGDGKGVIRSFEECPLVHKDFRVVVQTKFKPADYNEFLAKDMPNIDGMQHIIVQIDPEPE